MSKKADPITNNEEVRQNPDPKIDQDFPGFPGGNAKEEIINPKNKTDKKIAGVDKAKK